MCIVFELRSVCRERTTVLSYGEMNLIRVFNEALFMSGAQLSNSLNQLRHFGYDVQDKPCSGRVIPITSPDGEVVIPLVSDGTTI